MAPPNLKSGRMGDMSGEEDGSRRPPPDVGSLPAAQPYTEPPLPKPELERNAQRHHSLLPSVARRDAVDAESVAGLEALSSTDRR